MSSILGGAGWGQILHRVDDDSGGHLGNLGFFNRRTSILSFDLVVFWVPYGIHLGYLTYASWDGIDIHVRKSIRSSMLSPQKNKGSPDKKLDSEMRHMKIHPLSTLQILFFLAGKVSNVDQFMNKKTINTSTSS